MVTSSGGVARLGGTKREALRFARWWRCFGRRRRVRIGFVGRIGFVVDRRTAAPFANGIAEHVLDLRVETSQFVLRPSAQIVQEFRRKTQ